MMWRHMLKLWPRFTLAPMLPFWGWAIYFALRYQFRWDQFAVAILVTALAYGNSWTKRLFIGLLPIGLVGLFYDAMRVVKNVGLTPANVHVCDLRKAELTWFGVGPDVTLHDWFQAHASLPLDLFAAVPYGTFLFAVVGYALFLFVRDFRAEQLFMWSFFVLNIAGFVTYHLYPAAPPWYFHLHGCTVDLAAPASAGPNLTRVDAWLGISYFAGFYGRSSDVFGAVPSLHVAYPLLMALSGWKKHGALGRTLLVAFYLWMCFAAVYLDHHWVIDVALGSVYTVVVVFAMRALARFGEAHLLSPEAAAVATPLEQRRWQS